MKRSIQHAFEPEEIMAYLDGELDPQPASELATHLESCADCQSIAAQLRQISDRLLDFQVETCPSEMTELVFSAAETTTVKPSMPASAQSQAPRRRARIVIWAVAGAFAALLIAAVSIPNLLRSKMPVEGMERARVIQAQPGSADLRANAFSRDGQPLTDVVTPAQPGAVADSNGLFHGLGDHAANASRVGQRPTDQEREVFQGKAGQMTGPMIVQTASMTILTPNYDQASIAVRRLAPQRGGYIQDSTANAQTGAARSLSTTIRVPEKQLEPFLADLRKLGHVEQETHSNQEITAQYVDLNARLKNARATEQRVLNLLSARTGNLGDVLQAERELARIRTDIESMDRDRASMEHQVRYATVEVQLNEQYREQLNPESFTTGTRVRNSVIAGFQNLEDSILSLAVFLFAYGPSILLWGVLLGVPAWIIWRRFRSARQS
jgi:hypothetical protein